MDKFSRGLYLEHLEEASFLYDQRRHLLNRRDFPWSRIADFEERLAAHLDGLYYGGNDALEVCADRLEEGDAGEYFAAMCVYARLDRLDLIRKALEKLDDGDTEKVTAFTEALKFYWPAVRGVEDLRALLEIKAFGLMVPVIIGFKRLAMVDLLLHPHCRTPKALTSFCWCTGRLRDEKLHRMIELAGKSDDKHTFVSSVLACLRMGSKQAVDLCLRDADAGKVWPLIWLGISDGKSRLDDLKKIFAGGKASPDVLTAMGYLGDPACFDLLMSQLSVEKYASAAADALDCITGAGLYEDAFIADPVDESELSDEELERHRKGEAVYPPGEEPGKTVIRLSQNARVWHKWIQDRCRDFKAGYRYRDGKLFSPLCLLETLQSKTSPFYSRQLACEELAIRYGIDIGLEADDIFVNQCKILAAAQIILTSESAAFKPGAWYFGGKLVE